MVLSTGSIAFGQVLPDNGFNNTTSKLLKNVVDVFINDIELPGGQWTLEEKQ